MYRKLYLAPIIHGLDLVPLGLNSNQIRKVREIANNIYSDSIRKIYTRLEGRKIDKLFVEAFCTKTDEKDLEHPQLKELCKRLGILGVERTETGIGILAHKIANYLPYNWFFEDIIDKRRDYEIAEITASGLKNNETGLLIFGSIHKPEGYISVIASDITLSYVTRREEMENEYDKIIKVSKSY